MEIVRQFVSGAALGGRRAGAGGWPCQGLWHHPAGQAPKTAVIATHYEVDFCEHYLAEHLAELGYGFLGWNTRFRHNGAWFALKPALADIAFGVRWLREQAGVEHVVLLGNSGGASLMAAYQAMADDLGHPGGDLFVSLNAHRGRPDILTSWLDPSVTDETDPLSVDPALDMFNPDNGPPYAPEFVERYRAAQVARNERITTWVKTELARLGRRDRIFAVPRTSADLRFLDLELEPTDRRAGCYFGDARKANSSGYGLAAACTLRAWLDMWSLSDSLCRAEMNMARIAVPALVVQSLADEGCYPSDAQAMYSALASADKSLEWLAGDHYFLDEPGARPAVAALIARWLADHKAT